MNAQQWDDYRQSSLFVHAIEAAIIGVDSVCDALEATEKAYDHALNSLFAISGANNYGGALDVYEKAKAKVEQMRIDATFAEGQDEEQTHA